MDTDLIKNAKASKALPIEASGLLLESIHGYRFDKEHCQHKLMTGLLTK